MSLRPCRAFETTTEALFALSGPVQLLEIGFTEYDHVPAATAASLHVVAAIVPTQVPLGADDVPSAAHLVTVYDGALPGHVTAGHERVTVWPDTDADGAEAPGTALA